MNTAAAYLADLLRALDDAFITRGSQLRSWTLHVNTFPPSPKESEMAEKMTLGQVRDKLASWLGGSEACLDARNVALLESMVSACDASLAQAVDVGAIREVIDELNIYCETSDDSCYGTLSTSLVRDYTGRLTRAIDNKGNGVA